APGRRLYLYARNLYLYARNQRQWALRYDYRQRAIQMGTLKSRPYLRDINIGYMSVLMDIAKEVVCRFKLMAPQLIPFSM
ncbi:hypothetical protein ACFL5Z_18765, partial [Planctomycetota bacterium]